MHKPKLLFIGALPPPYIGPSVANQKLIQSPALNNAFEIIHLDTSDRRNPQNIGKMDFGNALLAIRHISLCLYRLFRWQPEIVYLPLSQGLWGLVRDLGFILPAVVLRKKVIAHLRGSEFDQIFVTLPRIVQAMTRWAFRRVSRALVLGNSVKHLFRGLFPDHKVVVVPNGIDYHPFEPNGAADRRNGILFLSSLLERKGIFQFLEALPRVFEQYPNLKVTIAGTWQDPGDKKKLDALIAAHKLEQKVRFAGEVGTKTKIQLYHHHALFVFPPIQPEGMPWVILEAMSAKLPVITTAQGTIPEVVEDQQTGFIINPTPENIAEKICYLLENPDLAMEMGQRGRKRIEAHFSEEVYFERLKSVFLDALNS